MDLRWTSGWSICLISRIVLGLDLLAPVGFHCDFKSCHRVCLYAGDSEESVVIAEVTEVTFVSLGDSR